MNGPPAAVRASVEHNLAGVHGGSCTIVDVKRVGGGCISPSARIRLDDGPLYFLKWDDGSAPDGLFAAEARGLADLRRSGVIRVPEVVVCSDSWLLLEWLEPAPAGGQTWRRLGRELAAMHRQLAAAFGSDADNFIGSLPQSNEPTRRWADFWRDHRLVPQLTRAANAFGRRDRDRFDRFIRNLDELLGAGDDDGPSLLHGDLWNGNVHVTEEGRAALVDPSVYHGHREVDLAMAALFGGFGRGFFEEYTAEWPLAPGWMERRAAYQLYYLLVHVNLFGAGYVSSSLEALRSAGG